MPKRDIKPKLKITLPRQLDWGTFMLQMVRLAGKPRLCYFPVYIVFYNRGHAGKALGDRLAHITPGNKVVTLVYTAFPSIFYLIILLCVEAYLI